VLSYFYKNKETDKTWWVENNDTVGEFLFSFDKKKIFNLFADYPHNLTKQQKEIFDNENPYWADFLKKEPQNEYFILGAACKARADCSRENEK